MTKLIVDGEKFALIAFETRSEVNLPPTELTPGLWVSNASMIGMDEFWKNALGTSQIDHLRLQQGRVAGPLIS